MLVSIWAGSPVLWAGGVRQGPIPAERGRQTTGDTPSPGGHNRQARQTPATPPGVIFIETPIIETVKHERMRSGQGTREGTIDCQF